MAGSGASSCCCCGSFWTPWITLQVIMIHLKENDLCQRMSLSLRLQIHRDLQFLFCWLPGITILWSDMLPRRVWHGTVNPAAVDWARYKTSAYLRHLKGSTGGGISHPQIGFDDPSLYRGDGIHLSLAGTDIFLFNLQQALRSLFGFCGGSGGQALDCLPHVAGCVLAG